MVLPGRARNCFWIVLLLSTNILTAVFVAINTGDSRGLLYLSLENYEDTNAVYHSTESSRRHRDTAQTESPLAIQNRKTVEKFQKRLQRILHQFGVLEGDSAVGSVGMNCSIASLTSSCDVASVRTTADINTASHSVCWDSLHTNITVIDKCKRTTPSKTIVEPVETDPPRSIFAITPTYARFTQKVDLTSLCQTLMNVEHIVWVVIEDALQKTSLVSDLLERCKVTSVHLNVRTPPSYRPKPGADRYKELYSRGVKQRNLGLSWIRGYCTRLGNCTGAVYFMDDDNKYDLRLFDIIRNTKLVSVFPVGFSGGLKVEGPLCDDGGKAVTWHAEWDPQRPFPIDMAGFAVQIDAILAKPDVWVGFDESGEPTPRGYLETCFLEKFANRDTVECSSNNREVLVWHVKTQKPWILFEANNPTDDHFEI